MAIEKRIYELTDEQTTIEDADLGVLDKSGYTTAKKFSMLKLFEYINGKIDPNNVLFFANSGVFPVTGEVDYLYVAKNSGSLFLWNGSNYFVINPQGIEEFTQLSDVPSSYSGEGGKVVVVNGTEDGLEFKNIALYSSLYPRYVIDLNQSGGNDVNSLQGGPLIVGVTYEITNYIEGDDFTNVGALDNSNGTRFVATGVNPAEWSNESDLTYNNGAPSLIVLNQNEITANGWAPITALTFSADGSYVMEFPINTLQDKFVQVIPPPVNASNFIGSPMTNTTWVTAFKNDNSSIGIATQKLDTGTGDITLENGILYTGYSIMEIRILDIPA